MNAPATAIRVLVVDDSEADAVVLSAELDRGLPGIETRWAHGAEPMFDAIAAWQPHVVLTDVHMPRFDIFAALKRIRAAWPLLPVVVVSGLVGEEMAASIIKAGANDFVAKSGIARLAVVVERELRDARQQAEKAELSAHLRRQQGLLEHTLRSLSQRLLEAQERERRWIAQELHDDIGQAIAAMRFQLARIVEQSHEASAREMATDALKSSEQLNERLRQICLGLRPLELDDFGLMAALRSLVASLGRRPQLALQLLCEGTERRYPAAVETAAFRIAQEAINNALRHSGCGALQVRVQMHSAELVLSVIDDGCGFSVDSATTAETRARHLGLAGMEERAISVAGSLQIDSDVGRGTAVQARFVLANRGADSAPAPLADA